MHNVVVIMSVYRSDNVLDLKNAVDSILFQSFLCDLFIYRDGLVSDEMETLLTSYEINNVNLTYIRSQYNQGLSNALNLLIELAIKSNKYDYIARMDSDDISRPLRIEKQVSFLNCHTSVDVCGTSCKEFGASYALDEKHLPQSHEELLDFSITRCPFIHPSVMFRTSVFTDGARYPTNTLLTEDMALWFKLLESGYRFANINEVLLDYRLNENTIERRKGLGKALSEVRIRISNMFLLKKVTLKNVVLISARPMFHLMPSCLIKLAYKKAR